MGFKYWLAQWLRLNSGAVKQCKLVYAGSSTKHTQDERSSDKSAIERRGSFSKAMNLSWYTTTVAGCTTEYLIAYFIMSTDHERGAVHLARYGLW